MSQAAHHHQAEEPKYYVVEDGVPIPQRKSKSLVRTINSLQDGQSFIVPTAKERMRAIGLARSRHITLVSQKVEDGGGDKGYRIWRQAVESAL